MIQANELRKNNLVKDRGGKILKIDWFENDKICQSMGTYETEQFGKIPYHPLTEDFKYLQPIELTEEILLKCGFEERINSSMVKFWNKNNFTIYHEYYKHNVVDNLEWFFLSSADFDRLRIYSLHQLQNLYFALTNQELEINL